ncbi:MAG TPA: F0F1 ATP synthase subunit delta [Candidatus Acidoferrum sp.]|nr:F0F1 ATP synthase subunit delta [Candidatus Acidoferrum sp.]
MIKGNLFVAGPFGAEEVGKIEAYFTRMLGDRVVLKVKKDDKLIGGFLATVDGKAYDASVLGRMKDMQHHMLDKE